MARDLSSLLKLIFIYLREIISIWEILELEIRSAICTALIT